MVAVLYGASDATIDRILDDPPLIWQLVAADDPEMYTAARAANSGFLSRLLGGGKRAAPLELGAYEGELTDLDKAWHGIHWLLTRSDGEGAAPLDFLAAGGAEVPGQEVGYGTARAFRAAEVRAIHEALGRLADDELRSRFDPAAMTRAEIYPDIWMRPAEEDDTLAYLISYVDNLRGVLAKLTEQDVGLVIAIT